MPGFREKPGCREEQPASLRSSKAPQLAAFASGDGFVWELTICLVAKGSEMC